jgi:hypothetical protein
MGPERDHLTTDETLASPAEAPTPVPWSVVNANLLFDGRIRRTRFRSARDAYHGRIHE